MNTFKNYLIAILTGLLALTITTQPSIGAGKSKDAKIAEYDTCLKASMSGLNTTADIAQFWTIKAINACKVFQP